MNFQCSKESTKFLCLLLLVDLAFIVVHIFYSMGLVSDPLFSIETDFGFAEVFQYIKEYWIVAMLLILTIKSSRVIYFSWALLFLYLLLDDSLRIHEKLGANMVDYFDFKPVPNILRAQDFGELSVSMLFGAALFSAIGVAYFFSDKLEKQISKTIFGLVMMLAFFGVLVDLLHMAIPWWKPLFGLIEDGGEMFIVSIIVWYVFMLKLTPTTFVGDNSEHR